MADSGKSTGLLEKASVGGDAGAIQFNSQGKEGSVVKREGQFSSQARGSLQQRGSRRSYGDGKRFQALDGIT